MPPRRALLAAVTAALLAAGCALPEGAAPAPEEPASEPTGALTTDPDGTDTPAEFAGDVRVAYRGASTYWSGRLQGFRPVRQVIAYERAGEVDCAGEPLPRNNAVYCPAGDFIAYDVNWAFGAFRQIGDAFVYYLLAHEYGHAVQARLGIRKELTIEQELQADCLAGAFIGDEVREGTLRLAPDDTEELARGLEAVGDEPGQPWFAEGAHGTAAQRTRAFAAGYERSLEACDL